MKEEILELVLQNKYAEVKKNIIKLNVVDIAQLLEELDDRQKIIIIFRLLPKETAADVFSYFPSDMQEYVVASITDKEIKTILDELFLDDVVDFIEEMPSNVVRRVLKNTDEQTRKLINQFLNYPDDSVGSIMTIEYVDLKANMTVAQAIAHIKKTGVDKATINTCYVTAVDRQFLGTISIRKLILSDETLIIGDIMNKELIYSHTLDDREVTAAKFKKYDLLSIPVVDNENRLVGIVTIDDIVDIIDKENTEDFQKMAAMHPSEEAYLKTSVWNLSKHRIVWLLVLMFSAVFTGEIIRRFEDVLSATLILASFIPMLMDTGGNAGSQSSTLIIRGLALGDVKTKDILKVLWKEFRVSLLVGIALATANFLRLMLLQKAGILISSTVCISLLLTVVLAKVVGGILPIIAKKLRLDPAIMAGPIITTIVDAFALFIYFQLATFLLGIK